MRYLYVMVSRTDTGFARLIRRFTGCYYNHAAISFDCDLRQLYSFARRAYDLPLSACLTRESPLMYTRGLPAYKAQTCSEFTAGILRIAGLRLDRPDCRYHPEDFTHLLEGLEVYRGSLAAYCGENRRLDGDPEYLRRHSLLQIAGCSLRTLACAADRSLFERPSGLPDVTGQYFAHTHR